jgi:processive 1,2-diacylglycerol beta-glucosyltransferase
MAPPRLLILSVSAGAGHVRAAEAVRQAAVARGWSARHVDVMELVPRLFRKLYAESFITLVNRSPALWGYLYHTSDNARRDSTVSKIRRAVERLNTRKLASLIADEAPTHVVCTHFLPAELCGRMRAKGTLAAPVHVVVTDFDIHSLWVQPNLAGYCVAADEVAWRLRPRLDAIAAGSTPVTVTGIPIVGAFSQPPDRATAAGELGIRADRTTLLLMSGGLGVGAIDQLAERLLAIPGDFQLVAMAGKNVELLGKLEALAKAHPGRVKPLGFTSTPERVMAAADLAISKPGGLTTSECLAMGLPMLIVSPIPGQEERNSDYLLENGAAEKAHDAAGVDYRVRRLLAEPARLRRLRTNAAAIGRPAAAAAVLATIAGA